MSATYYEDIVAASENDITSRNFCTLVDTVFSLFEEEEEERLRLLAEKAKSKYEEESDNNRRVFCLFPRKKRSFVYRRKNSLHGEASTSSLSSSLLLDLNTISSDVSEPQNPPCFNSLCVTVESEMKNPPNPNSQASKCIRKKASLKRRAVPERKRSGGSKKAKADPVLSEASPVLSWRGRDIPESILRIMRKMNVREQGPKLIYERPKLYKTDVNPGQSRLSMPMNQVIRNDFLNPKEIEILKRDINKKEKMGIDAFLVNEESERWDVKLKRWESETSWLYIVTSGWNKFVAANGLVQGKGISVWTFRWYGLLYFAILPLPTLGQI